MRAGSGAVARGLPEARAGGRGAGALRRLAAALGLCAWALASAGCSEQDMVDQPKFKTLQPSTFFADGRSSRPLEPGTVAIGQLMVHPAFDAGEVDGKLVGYLPIKGFDPAEKLDPTAAREARKAAMERGRERFNIFCSPCHSRTGDGNGMIVQRGFSKPPALYEPRLREAPPGHFFKVITNGYGAMYSYASRIPTADRWAIIAYIRALQLSQTELASAAATAVPAAGGPEIELERSKASKTEGPPR
jgi:mono/diheme cytochrome c family protein